MSLEALQVPFDLALKITSDKRLLPNVVLGCGGHRCFARDGADRG